MLVAMTASLMCLLLRQVLRMVAQIARDGGAKDIEILGRCCVIASVGALNRGSVSDQIACVSCVNAAVTDNLSSHTSGKVRRRLAATAASSRCSSPTRPAG
jgi:hypothetical protein